MPYSGTASQHWKAWCTCCGRKCALYNVLLAHGTGRRILKIHGNKMFTQESEMRFGRLRSTRKTRRMDGLHRPGGMTGLCLLPFHPNLQTSRARSRRVIRSKSIWRLTSLPKRKQMKRMALTCIGSCERIPVLHNLPPAMACDPKRRCRRHNQRQPEPMQYGHIQGHTLRRQHLALPPILQAHPLSHLHSRIQVRPRPSCQRPSQFPH